MTENALKIHTEFRRLKVESFLAEPAKFKVCDQCGSIVPVTSGLCPFCHCYRFDETAEGVIATAALIGVHPFPLTAGTVPRLTLDHFAHISGHGKQPA